MVFWGQAFWRFRMVCPISILFNFWDVPTDSSHEVVPYTPGEVDTALEKTDSKAGKAVVYVKGNNFVSMEFEGIESILLLENLIFRPRRQYGRLCLHRINNNRYIIWSGLQSDWCALNRGFTRCCLLFSLHFRKSKAVKQWCRRLFGDALANAGYGERNFWCAASLPRNPGLVSCC